MTAKRGDDIEFVRQIVKEYDAGDLPEAWAMMAILERYLTPKVESASQGHECGHFTSVCGGEDNPPKVKRAIIEVGALGRPIWFKPLTFKNLIFPSRSDWL
jgi:hypothetical protein